MRGPHQFVSGADACEPTRVCIVRFFYHTLASAPKGGFSDTPSVRGLVGCRRFQAACAKTQRRNLVSLSWIRFSPTLYNMAVSVCSHTFLPQRSRVATTPDPGRFLHALPLKGGKRQASEQAHDSRARRPSRWCYCSCAIGFSSRGSYPSSRHSDLVRGAHLAPPGSSRLPPDPTIPCLGEVLPVGKF